MAGVKVSIGADSRKAERELKSFERKTKKIAGSIAKGFKERIGHKMFDGLASAARSIPGLLNEAIDSASSLNEEVSKSQTIFGKSAAGMRKWAQGADEAMGLSEVAALEATGTVGNMFRAMGLGEAEAAKMSRSMVELASDMGSFNNTSAEDAIQAIGAALRGESEPIRRYGVLLDDATLKAEALAKGLHSGKGALTPVTRAMAAYSVIMKQTTTAQGDFKNTSDGLANSQKILKAQLANASSEIGDALLPVMKQLVQLMRDTDFKEVAQDIGVVVGALANLTSGAMKAYEGWKYFMDAMNGKQQTDAAETIDAFAQPEGLEGADFFLKYGTDEKKAEIRKLLKEQEEAEKKKRKMIKETQKVETPPKSDQTQEAGPDNIDRKPLSDDVDSEEGRKRVEVESVNLSDESDREEDRKRAEIDRLTSTYDDFSDMFSAGEQQSSLQAVSSMQRIGGGGGSFGALDIQKRQADLQADMVNLLQQINSKSEAPPVSDF